MQSFPKVYVVHGEGVWAQLKATSKLLSSTYIYFKIKGIAQWRPLN